MEHLIWIIPVTIISTLIVTFLIWQYCNALDNIRELQSKVYRLQNSVKEITYGKVQDN